jgi:hypothetical protein
MSIEVRFLFNKATRDDMPQEASRLLIKDENLKEKLHSRSTQKNNKFRQGVTENIRRLQEPNFNISVSTQGSTRFCYSYSLLF